MKNFNPKEVTIIVAGIPIDSGFAEDEFVTIEDMAPRFVSTVGVDGEVTRVKQNDRRVKVTIKLMQSSDCNARLSALATLDAQAENGAGVGPFLIRDRQGTSLYAGEKSWVAEQPKRAFGKTAKEREWVIEVADCTVVDGGN